MDAILNFQQFLSVLGEPIIHTKIKDFQAEFDNIAKYMFGNIAICAGGVLYFLAEIEFYYKNSRVNSETFTRTYKRNTKAGQLLWHYSGVDICFSTLENGKSYGGILIRSLMKKVIENNETKYELITGPMRCANELINQCIECEVKDIPYITQSSISINNDILATIRQGIETCKTGSDKNEIEAYWSQKEEEIIPCFCYYIKRTRDEWNHMGNKYIAYNSMPLFFEKEGREGISRVIEKLSNDPR